MATSRSLTPDMMRVLDSMSGEVAKSFMKGIEKAMNQEAASFFKSGKMAAGGKKVIGKTYDPQEEAKKAQKKKEQADRRAAAELRRMQKGGEDHRSKMYKWFMTKKWGPQFLRAWFGLWNNKIFLAVKNSFDRVTGFLRQQMDDILGEFAPLVDFVKNIFINLKDVVVGTAQLIWKVGKGTFSFIKKMFSSNFLKGMVTSIRSMSSSLGKKLDKIISANKKSLTAKTIIVGEKRGVGRPRKVKTDEKSLLSIFTIASLGGMLGRMLKIAVPVALAVAGFGIFKTIKNWLAENPEIKQEVDWVALEIKKGFKSLFGAAWEGFKDFIKESWKTTPDWAKALIGAGVGSSVLGMGAGKKIVGGVLGTLLGGVGGALSLGTGLFKKKPSTTTGEQIPIPGLAGQGAEAGKAASKIGSLLKGSGKFIGKLGLYGFIAGLGLDLIDSALSDDDELIAKAKGKNKADLTDKMQSFLGNLASTLTFGALDKQTALKSFGIDVDLSRGQARAGQMPAGGRNLNMPGISAELQASGNWGQRLNNPGNIKSNQKTGKAYMAAGLATESDFKASDGGYFLRFKTPEDGWNAMYDALKGSFTGNTVDERMNIWSNRGYGAAGIGMGNIANKKMKDLTDDEMKTLMHKMATREGYYAKSKGGAKLSTGAETVSQRGILGLLSGGMLDDPLLRMMYGDEMDALEAGMPLTREEMSKRTGETGQGSAALQQQEANLIRQEADMTSASQNMTNQIAAPLPAGVSNQLMASNISGSGSQGTPDPSPSLLGGGIPMYMLVNNSM